MTLLAAIISITVIATSLVDFQFKNIVQSAFPTKDALTEFFGTYYAAINLITILTQLLVTGRLLRRFGVGVAILLMPITLLAGSAAMLISPVLWAAILVKTCDDIFSLSINKWGTEILYIPIPMAIKQKAKTFIDVVVERMSRGFGGILLLVLTALLSLSIRQLSIPVVALLVGWIYFAVRIHREYVASIEATLQKRSLNVEALTTSLSDYSTVKRLLPLLASDNERQVLYVLTLLEGVRDPEIAQQLQPLLRHPSPEIRSQAICSLMSLGPSNLVSQVEALTEDDDEGVRVEAIHYVSRHATVPSTQKLQAFLMHPDYTMKNAAITCIARYGSRHERGLLTVDLIDLLLMEKGTQHTSARLGAAKALGVIGVDSQLLDSLWLLLNDEDISVVRQAITTASRTESTEFIPFLIDKLGDPKVRVAVRESLAQRGPAVLDSLLPAMCDSQLSVSIRRQIPKVIGLIAHQGSVDALMAHLDLDEVDIRHKIVRALGELRTGQANVHFDPRRVSDFVDQSIGEYYRLSMICDAQTGEDTKLLAQALQERLELWLEMAFGLLGLIHSPRSMYNAYRGVRSQNPRVRANAVELLDNILSRDTKRKILPAVDTALEDTFLQRAATFWGLHPMTDEEAIVLLISGRDPWLAACALYTVGQKQMIPLEAHVREARDNPHLLIRESAELAWRRLRGEELSSGS